MCSTYFLRNLTVNFSTPLKQELIRTLSEVKKSLEIAKQKSKDVGSVEYQYSPRKRWRVTYLKSRFKHRKAIRHYVFEQYNYQVNIYRPSDISEVVSSVLGSLSPSVKARCVFSWAYKQDLSEKNTQEDLNSQKAEKGIVKQILERI